MNETWNKLDTTVPQYTTSRPQWTTVDDMATTSGQYFPQGPQKCPPEDWGADHLRVYYMEIICLSSIFAMATFGNICVLLALWQRRTKTNRMHLFIMHLAISDLVVAFFQVLPELIIRLSCGFHASNSTCKFVKFMQILGMYGSTYVLICTAFDRFFAIRYPMKSLRMSRGFVHCTVLAAWCVSALLSIPQIILFKKPTDGSPYCEVAEDGTFSKAYLMWYFFMILIIPTFLLGYFYGMIARTVVRNAQQKKRLRDNPHRQSRDEGDRRGRKAFTPRASGVGVISRAKIKTVKMTFVIVITFVFCWTPFYTAQLIGAFNPQLTKKDGVAILFLIASLNSCTNPWIYLFFSGSLLKELKRQYCCNQDKSQEKRGRYFPQTDGAQSYVTETIKVEMIALNSSCKKPSGQATSTTITTVNDVD